MAIVKIQKENELYVYMNGSLLYKRWLKDKFGKVFCPIFGCFSAKDTESFRTKQQ